MDGRVVELDALTDTDGAGSEHDDLLFIRQARGVLAGVGRVKVGNIFAGVESVDHFEDRSNAVLFADIVDIDFGNIPQGRDIFVGEAHDLGGPEDLDIALVRLDGVLHLHDLFEGSEEQFSDHGHFMQFFYAHAAAQQFKNRIDVIVPECCDIVKQLVVGIAVKLGQAEMTHAGLERAHGLEAAFFQSGADTHHFAGRLHLGAEGVGRVGKFIKGESREFCDDIVEGWFDRGGAAGDGDLIQRHAHGDLGGHAGDGIAARLRRQRRRARHPGIDLDQIILAGFGMQRELYVASALDLELTDDFDRAVVEHFQVMLV